MIRLLFIALSLLLNLAFASHLLAGSTLDSVRERGFINCGVHSSLPGFAILSKQGWLGLEVDLCRAVAAAVLNDAKRVRFTPLASSQGYSSLQSGDIDLLVRHNQWSMFQDTALGLTFVAPWFYEQQGFLLQQASLISELEMLKGIRICVHPATEDVAGTLHFDIQEVSFPSFGIAVKAFENGQCDALSGQLSQLYIARLKFPETLATNILPNTNMTFALGPLVRHQDQEWFKIVRWTINLLFSAEAMGLKRDNIGQIQVGSPKHKKLQMAGMNGISIGLNEHWPITVISQLGHYGEIFTRNLGPYQIPREANSLYGQGGLHFTPPME